LKLITLWFSCGAHLDYRKPEKIGEKTCYRN
jgi:hypothetical protein